VQSVHWLRLDVTGTPAQTQHSVLGPKCSMRPDSGVRQLFGVLVPVLETRLGPRFGGVLGTGPPLAGLLGVLKVGLGAQRG